MADADLEHDYTLELSKHVKQEMEETNGLTPPCKEVPWVKIEKIEEDKSDLYMHQSENYAQSSSIHIGHQVFRYSQNIILSYSVENPLILTSLCMNFFSKLLWFC